MIEKLSVSECVHDDWIVDPKALPPSFQVRETANDVISIDVQREKDRGLNRTET